MKTCFALICLLFLGLFSAEGQITQLLDSLQLKLSHTEGVDRLPVLSDLSWYSRAVSTEQSMTYAQQELQEALTLGDSARVAQACNDVGIAFTDRGALDTALLFYSRAMAIRKLEGNQKRIASLANKIGIVYQNLAQLDSSIAYSMQALTLYETIGDTINQAHCLNNIANLFFRQGNMQKSLELHHKNLELRTAIRDSGGISASLLNIGNVLTGKQDNQQALQYYLRSLPLARKFSSPKDLSTLLHNLASAYVFLEETDLARPYLEEALAIRQQLGNKPGIVSSSTALGLIYQQANQPEAALVELRKAQSLAASLNLKLKLEVACRYLAEIFTTLGQHDSAYFYMAQSYNLLEANRRTELNEQLAEYQTRYETQKKEVALRQVQQEAAEARLEIANRRNQFIIALGGGLLIALAGFFLIYRQRQKARSRLAEVRLEEQQKGLKGILDAQEMERKRISKDLHDGIVQQLTGLNLGLQKLFQTSPAKNQERMLNILNDSTRELRELSHQMMPRSLSKLGLVPALKDMLENSLGHANLEYTFEPVPFPKRLPENAEITLFRIAQELTNNILKHSKASEVNVQLYQVGKTVILLMEDNGKGLQNEQVSNGIGLMNINSRLSALKGKLDLSTSPEGGTLAMVTIPA